jgi:hypothetical protein
VVHNCSCCGGAGSHRQAHIGMHTQRMWIARSTELGGWCCCHVALHMLFMFVTGLYNVCLYSMTNDMLVVGCSAAKAAAAAGDAAAAGGGKDMLCRQHLVAYLLHHPTLLMLGGVVVAATMCAIMHDAMLQLAEQCETRPVRVSCCAHGPPLPATARIDFIHSMHAPPSLTYSIMTQETHAPYWVVRETYVGCFSILLTGCSTQLLCRCCCCSTLALNDCACT